MKKLSEEHKRKISQALKGKRPKNFEEAQRKAHEGPYPTGKDHPSWKGDDVGYIGIHAWVRKTLGTPQKCARCGTESAKSYEWANISREYRRDPSDWIRLCTSCHRKEGYERGEYRAWNKGRKVQTNTGRTHIKPRQRISPDTEFKQGLVPWNKRLEPRICPTCGKEFQPPHAKRKYCSQRCYWDSLRKEPRK